MGPNIHVKLNQDTLKVIIYGAVKTLQQKRVKPLNLLLGRQ